MTTTTAIVVATLTAVAVTTGGWVAGRTATGQPVLPGTGSTAQPSPSSEQSASGTAVEYRGLRLRIPDDWQVHRQEDTFDPVYSQQGPITEEWLLVQTDPSQQCGSPEWVYGHYECDRVMVFGPGGLSGGSMGTAFSPDRAFQPENQPYSCDPTLSTSAEPPAESPVSAETTDIGGNPAQYREWGVSCIDAPGDGVTTAGPQVYYDQRLWYLPEQRILIVDNYATEGLPGILAEAQAG